MINNPTPEHKTGEKCNAKRCTRPIIPRSSMAHNIQKMESTLMSADR